MVYTDADVTADASTHLRCASLAAHEPIELVTSCLSAGTGCEASPAAGANSQWNGTIVQPNHIRGCSGPEACRCVSAPVDQLVVPHGPWPECCVHCFRHLLLLLYSLGACPVALHAHSFAVLDFAAQL
eukprot:2779341-Amphidinium_carterae.1